MSLTLCYHWQAIYLGQEWKAHRKPTDVIKPSFSSPEYFVSEGHSAKGFYSMHLNALYDLHNLAFCDMGDRRTLLPDTSDVFIGDRDYCSYNNMAHVMGDQSASSGISR